MYDGRDETGKMTQCNRIIQLNLNIYNARVTTCWRLKWA